MHVVRGYAISFMEESLFSGFVLILRGSLWRGEDGRDVFAALKWRQHLVMFLFLRDKKTIYSRIFLHSLPSNRSGFCVYVVNFGGCEAYKNKQDPGLPWWRSG